MCLGISGVWTHLGKGNQADMGKKIQARLFVLHAMRILCLCLGFPGSLVLSGRKIAKKVTQKKGRATGLLEEMGPKFLKFHLMRFLPSAKIITPSPSSNPKLPIALPQRHRFCHPHCHH
jgi:hypothetical protein